MVSLVFSACVVSPKNPLLPAKHVNGIKHLSVCMLVRVLNYLHVAVVDATRTTSLAAGAFPVAAAACAQCTLHSCGVFNN